MILKQSSFKNLYEHKAELVQESMYYEHKYNCGIEFTDQLARSVNSYMYNLPNSFSYMQQKKRIINTIRH